MNTGVRALAALVMVLILVSEPSVAISQSLRGSDRRAVSARSDLVAQQSGPAAKPNAECCQPDLKEYYQKKRAALELYKATSKQLDDAVDNFLHNVLEEMPEDLAGEIKRELPLSLTKLSVVFALTQYEQWLINLINTGVAEKLGLLLTSWTELQVTEGVIEIAEAVGIAATIGVILTEAGDYGFYVHEAYREMDDAKQMLAAANAMYDSAVAALDRALRKSAACEKEREQRMQPAKSADDRAHELMESWDNNGYLYKDPWGGPPLDAQAAFERAKQILSGVPSRSELRAPAIRRVRLVGTSAVGVPLTTQQLGGLVTDSSHGKDTYARAMDQVIKWVEALYDIGKGVKDLQAELDNLDARTDAISKALNAKCQPQSGCAPIDNSDCPSSDPLCHGLGQCR